MKEYRFTVIYTQDERGVWTAYVPDLNNLASEGDTVDEAQRMIQEAIDLYLECLERDNPSLLETVLSRNTFLGTVGVAR